MGFIFEHDWTISIRGEGERYIYQFQWNKFLGNICPSRERDIRSQPGSFYIYIIQETRPFQLNFTSDPRCNNSYTFFVSIQIFAFRNFEIIIIHEKIASFDLDLSFIFFFFIRCQDYRWKFYSTSLFFKKFKLINLNFNQVYY